MSEKIDVDGQFSDSEGRFKPKLSGTKQNASTSTSVTSTVASYSCKLCKKSFLRSSSLCKHKKICKGIENDKSKCEVKKKREGFVCALCDVQFTHRRSVNRHMKKCKGVKDDKKYTKCFIPSCDRRFYSRLHMIYHLNDMHQQENVVELLSFDNGEKFEEFRKEENMKHIMSTVKRSARKERKNCSYEAYICNFDVQEQKRSAHRIPGCKCPARMLVKIVNGVYQVKYIKDHNHPIVRQNLKHHRYPRKTIDFIKTLLLKGMSPQAIRDELVPPDVEHQFTIKEHLIDLREIRQIQYRLLKKSALCDTDAASITVLAAKLHSKEDSVLIYKPQGTLESVYGASLKHLPDPSNIFAFGYQNKRMRDEFIASSGKVVWVDDTHNTNQYCFRLLTVIVPDGCGHGYPVAYFISNSLDSEILTIFFNSLKERCPDLQINALVTDDDEALWSGFSSVFGEHIRHFLCIWHIKQSWTKELNAHIKSPELKDEIYAHLISLMEEENSNSFGSMLSLFINKYSVIQETKSFIVYFEKHYVNQCEKWALSYRNFPHTFTNTKVFSESYFRHVKQIFLKDRVNTKLVDLINILKEAEREKFLTLWKHRVLEDVSPSIEKVNNWQESHTGGMKISDDQVNFLSEDVWSVQSATSKGLTHIVSLKMRICPMPDHCIMRCDETACQDLCHHMYSCSCKSYESNPLCKHIHKVHSLRMKSVPHRNETEINQSIGDPDEWGLHDSPSPEVPTFETDSARKMTDEIFHLLDEIRAGINNEAVQKTLLPYIHNTLTKLESTIRSVKCSPCLQ